MFKNITRIDQVESFCNENIYEILQFTERWIVPPPRRDLPTRNEVERVLFEAALKLIKVDSVEVFFKKSSKERRRIWSRDFDGAIRNWLNREFPQRVHFTESEDILLNRAMMKKIKKNGGEETSSDAGYDCYINCLDFTECGPVCSEGSQCRNKEVQEIGNEHWRLQLYPKLINKEIGIGVFAKRKLAANEYLGFVTGEAMNKKTYLSLARNEKENTYLFGLSDEPSSIVWAINPKYYGNHTRLFNHNCESNCVFEVWTVKNQFFVKFRVGENDVDAEKELTVNYCWDKGSECYCGSVLFRHYFNGKPIPIENLKKIDEAKEKELKKDKKKKPYSKIQQEVFPKMLLRSLNR